MRARAVVKRVLDKLESGQADGVERLVVSAASIAEGECGDAEVFQRRHPLSENWADGSIALQIDAPNFAAAVVHVEIGGEFLVVRLKLNGARGIAIVFGDDSLVRFGGARHETEVLLHVAIGTE